MNETEQIQSTMARPDRPFRSHFHFSLKVISSLLICAFLSQDLAHAAGGVLAWNQNAHEAAAASGQKSPVNISSDAGVIRKNTLSAGEDLIINIQDAHSNLGAQRSISKILDGLVKNYNLNLVALEGAAGAVDTSLVSAFPVEKVRTGTGEYLLKEGKISAGEFYSMISAEAVQLYGAEDPALYKEDLETFKSLIENRGVIRRQLKGLRQAVAELELKIYSPELRSVRSGMLLHREGSIQFSDYWKDFSALAGQNSVDYSRYPNLRKLVTSAEFEKKIDFTEAGRQREALLEALASKLSKPGLQELLLKTLEFKKGKITPAEFHSYLERSAEKAGLQADPYKELVLYSRYISLYESIDMAAVFDEVRNFEDELQRKLLNGKDAEELYRLGRIVDVTGRFLEASLTSGDYEFYFANAASCEIANLRHSLEALGQKYGIHCEVYLDFALLESCIPDARKFYELAVRRNKTLVDNTLRRMKEDGVHVAALITGGFHSDGISKLMEEGRLSCLVVMPKFEADSPERPYIAIITRKPEESREEFKGSPFYIAAANYLSLSEEFNRLVHGNGIGFNEDFEQFPELAFAAVMGSYRLNGLGNQLPLEIREQFYQNVVNASARRGGSVVDPARLRSWMDTARVRVTGDFYDLVFKEPDGEEKNFRIYQEAGGKIRKIEIRRGKEGVSRAVQGPVADLIREGIPARAARVGFMKSSEFKVARQVISENLRATFQFRMAPASANTPGERADFVRRTLWEERDRYSRAKDTKFSKGQSLKLAAMAAQLAAESGIKKNFFARPRAARSVEGARLADLRTYFQSIYHFTEQVYTESNEKAFEQVRVFAGTYLADLEKDLARELTATESSWRRIFEGEKIQDLRARLDETRRRIAEFKAPMNGVEPELADAEQMYLWVQARRGAIKKIAESLPHQKKYVDAVAVLLSRLKLNASNAQNKILDALKKEIKSRENKRSSPAFTPTPSQAAQLKFLRRLLPYDYSEPTPAQTLSDLKAVWTEIKALPDSMVAPASTPASAPKPAPSKASAPVKSPVPVAAGDVKSRQAEELKKLADAAKMLLDFSTSLLKQVNPLSFERIVAVSQTLASLEPGLVRLRNQAKILEKTLGAKALAATTAVLNEIEKNLRQASSLIRKRGFDFRVENTRKASRTILTLTGDLWDTVAKFRLSLITDDVVASWKATLEKRTGELDALREDIKALERTLGKDALNSIEDALKQAEKNLREISKKINHRVLNGKFSRLMSDPRFAIKTREDRRKITAATLKDFDDAVAALAAEAVVYGISQKSFYGDSGRGSYGHEIQVVRAWIARAASQKLSSGVLEFIDHSRVWQAIDDLGDLKNSVGEHEKKERVRVAFLIAQKAGKIFFLLAGDPMEEAETREQLDDLREVVGDARVFLGSLTAEDRKDGDLDAAARSMEAAEDDISHVITSVAQSLSRPASAGSSAAASSTGKRGGTDWSRVSWPRAITATIAFTILSGLFLWDFTKRDAQAVPDNRSAPAAAAPSLALPPPPQIAQKPGAGALPQAALNPGQGWVSENDKLQGLRADMLDFAYRLCARLDASGKFAAEIPQLPRDQHGIPLLARAVPGKAPLLVYADGRTVSVSDPAMRNSFLKTGRFFNDPTHPFAAADLSGLEFVDVNIGGVPARVPKFNGPVPVGLAGNDLPQTPTFYTQEEMDRLLMNTRDKNNRTVPRVPSGVPSTQYSYENAATGNSILFLDSQTALARTQSDFDILSRRIALLDEFLKTPGLAAAEVDDAYNIKSRIANADKLPLRFIYPRLADGTLGQPYLSSDYTRPAPPEGSPQRVAIEKAGGGFTPGNEIVFNPVNDRQKNSANLIHRDTVYRALGTWATLSPYTARAERFRMMRPVYAIIVKGDELTGIQEYYEIPTFQTLVDSIPNTKILEYAKVDPKILYILSLKIQPVVKILDGGDTQLNLGGGYTLFTSNNPMFERLMLLQDKTLRENNDVMAVQINWNGSVKRVFKYNDKKDVDDLEALRVTAKAPVLASAYFTMENKQVTFIRRNTIPTILGMQIAADLRQCVRVFWSNVPADIAEWTRLRELPTKQNQNEFGFQILEPGNAATDKNWVVDPKVGYEINEAGKITVFESPLALGDRLRVKQPDGTDRAYRLRYVLANGTVVPWYLLTSSDTVIEIRDPETKSRLFSGSEYLRLSYERRMLSMVERRSRMGRAEIERYFAKVLTSDLGRFGITLQSYHPLDTAIGRRNLQAYREYLGELQRQVELKNLGNGLTPEIKIRLLSHLETVAHWISENGVAIDNGVMICLEPSDEEMDLWREEKLEAFRRQQAYESVLSSGGLIVSSNGEADNRYATLLQLNQMWGGDKVTLAYPEWVGNDVSNKKAFRRVILDMLKEELKARAKNPPVTIFRVHDPAAAKPLVDASLKEYEAYLATLRKELPVKKAAVNAAADELKKATGKKIVPAQKKFVRAGVELEMLVKRIADTERPKEEDPRRSLIYVRPADHDNKLEKLIAPKKPGRPVQVVIIPTPANSQTLSGKADEVATRRVENMKRTKQALEQGGMLVSVPSDPLKSHVLIRDTDPAKNPQELNAWQAVIDQKSRQLQNLRNQWLGLYAAGRDTADVEAKITALKKEFKDNTFRHVDQLGVFGPKGLLYIVETLGGTAEASADLAISRRAAADAAKEQIANDGGSVMRIRPDGITELQIEPAVVATAQKHLAEKLKEMRQEYEELLRDQAADPVLPQDPPDDPRRLRSQRIDDLADFLKAGNRYQEDGDTMIVTGGFRGAEHELLQSLRGEQNERKVFLQRDAQGVLTGVSMVWKWNGAAWKQERVYEPYPKDRLDRRRVKMTDMQTGKIFIETFEEADIVEAGVTFRENRPLQRETMVETKVLKVPGHPDRMVEHWERTIHHDYIPGTVIPSRSVTTAFTKEENAIVEGLMISQKTLRLFQGGPEAGKPIVIDNAYVYDVKYGAGAGELKGLNRHLAMDPSTGEERIIFYPSAAGNKGEAMVRLSDGASKARPYHVDIVTGELILDDTTSDVRDTGKTINSGRIFVRTDKLGRFERAHAVDADGKEVASFYFTPRLVGGVWMRGIVAVKGGQTASLLGQKVCDARGYAPDLELDQTFYFDADYNVLDAQGAPVGAAAASNAAGYTVNTKNSFNNFPPEYFPVAPSNWKIVEEISSNGNFSKARAVDASGNEGAVISRFPDGRFIVEFIAPDPAAALAANQPIRMAYAAKKVAGVYQLEGRAIRTTYEYEAPFTDPADADWVVDGRLGMPDIMNGLSSQIVLSQKVDAKKYLHESLQELRNRLGMEGPLTLVVTAVQMEHGGTSYVVRIKEDSLARIIVFFSSDHEANIMVNTRWEGENGVHGYEFSRGLLFHIEAAPFSMTSSQLVGEKKLDERQKNYCVANKIAEPTHLPEDTIAQLRASGIVINDSTYLSRISRKLVISGTELPFDARYVMLDDPFVGNFAVENQGYIRFMKGAESGITAPLGVSRGEIVYDTHRKMILRNTRFREHRKQRNEYLYEVLKSGDKTDQRNPGVIIYNYHTHTVYEAYGIHYVKDRLVDAGISHPYVLVSRDGFFLHTYNFKGDQYGQEQPGSSIYSTFTTRHWVDEKGKYGKTGDVYLLISETILSPEVRGQGASAYLYKNGKLLASFTSVGQPGVEAAHTVNPSDPNDLTITEMIYDKFSNGTSGIPAGKLGLTDVEAVKSIFWEIQERQDLVVSLERGTGLPTRVTRDPLLWLMNHWPTISWAAFFLLGSYSLYRGVREKFQKNPDKIGKDILGARLALTVTQRYEMATELRNSLLLGKHIPDDEKPAVIRNHFTQNMGFSADEADRIVEAYGRGDLSFDTPDRNYYQFSETFPLSPATASSNIQLASIKGYSPAVILRQLCDEGLVTAPEIEQAVEKASYGGEYRGDLRWRWAVKLLVSAAQNRLLRQSLTPALVDKFPPTPEANVLKYILRHSTMSQQELERMASGYTDFQKFIEDLITKIVVEPVFNRVVSGTFQGQITDAARQDALRVVTAEMLPLIHRNPSLLSSIHTGDIVTMPYPVNRAVEATTLRELIILKLIQRSPSETNDHSVGQFAAIWPYTLYQARQIDQALSAGKSQAEILQMIKSMNGAFLPVVKREFDRFNLITKRDSWRTSEEHVIEALRAELSKNRNRPLADIMTEIRKPLLGRPQEIAEHIERLLRDNPNHPTAEITEFVARDLHRLKLVDLFIELDLWDLFEFTQTEAEKARRAGRRELTVEQQIARTTGGAQQSLAQMAATASGATDDEKNALASSYKKTTLRLAAIDHPQATAADVATGVGENAVRARRLPFLSGSGMVSLGLVGAMTALLSPPVALALIIGGLIMKQLAFIAAPRKMPLILGFGFLAAGVCAAPLGLGVASFSALAAAAGVLFLLLAYRPNGTGLGALYSRIFGVFFSPRNFWGMGSAQQTGFYLSFAALIGAGVFAIFLAPKFIALGTLMIVLAPMLMPIVWSNMPVKEKLFWGGLVTGASTVYVAGILVFFLFSGLTPAAILAVGLYGFFYTALLVGITYFATVISFYQVAVSYRSHRALVQELWSHTARSLIGLGSLNPFRGFWGVLVSSRVPSADRLRHVMKVAVPFYVVGISLLLWGLIPAGLGVAALVASLVLSTAVYFFAAYVLSLLIGLLPRSDVPEFWENTFGAWYKELQWVEEHRRSPLLNGESVQQYFERLIYRLNELDLLSDDEAAQWRSAVRGAGNGRFVRPASPKGFELLKMTFFTISQKKPVPDVWSLLQASSTHVQASSEMFTHTPETSMPLGTFNDNTSFLGYMARTHVPEWNNFISRMVRVHARSLHIQRAVLGLREINERGVPAGTDAQGRTVYQDPVDFINSCSLLATDRKALYRALMKWLNERRPNNESVMDSMAQDFIEYHLLAAHDSGDMDYFQSVREASLHHDSLKEAFEEQIAVPGSWTEVFFDRYSSYQERVDLKLRTLFQDDFLWKNFHASSDGANLVQITLLENLIKSLEIYKNRLSTADPVRLEVERVVLELIEFDPVRSGGKGGPRFARMEQWAADFLEWREANFDRLFFLVRKMAQPSDATLAVDAKGQKPQDFLNSLAQYAELVTKARRVNVDYVFYNVRKDHFLNNYQGKHQSLALDLKSFYGTTVDFDAHVMNEPGQQVFRATWATLNNRSRNPHLAAVNPMMTVWADNTFAFPATWLYSISVRVWTSDVQRALRGALLDYGKYMGIPQTIGPFSPPGEDSEGLLMLQRSASRRGVFYTGTQIDWFTYRWGRPSLFSESLITTEMRYAFNVTRFIMDRGSYSVFFNPNIPANVKLTHLFLWCHYFISPFVLTLLILLPLLSPFSAFAFLKPLVFFAGASFFLMEAININNLNRHWRETASFWEAVCLAGRDVMMALPYYTFLIPFFFRAVWLGSLEMFTFVKTVKSASLSVWNDRQKFEELMLFKLFGPRGIPLNSLVGLAGLGSWLVGFFAMTPLAPILLLPYLLTSISFVSGACLIAAYIDSRTNFLGGYGFFTAIWPFIGFKQVMKRTFFHIRTANPSSEKFYKALAAEAKLRPEEIKDVTPSNVFEMIDARAKALARAQAAAASLGMPHDAQEAAWHAFRDQNTVQINEWAALREIDHQLANNRRTSVAAARLADAAGHLVPIFRTIFNFYFQKIRESGLQKVKNPEASEIVPFNRPLSLSPKLVVGATMDPRTGSGYEPVRLWALLATQPRFDYQFTIVAVNSAPEFAARAKSPFNVLVAPSAYDSPRELTNNLRAVFERRDEAARAKLSAQRQETRRARQLLEAAASVLATSGARESLGVLRSRTAGELRISLRYIQLPPTAPIRLLVEKGGMSQIPSQEEKEELPLPAVTLRTVEKTLREAARRMDDPTQASLILHKTAILSSRYISEGEEDQLGRRMEAWSQAMIRFEKMLESQNRLDAAEMPASQLRGTVAVITHDSLLRDHPENYLAQLRELDRQVEKLNQCRQGSDKLEIRHILLAADSGSHAAMDPRVASYFAGKEIIFAPGASVKEIQRAHPEIFRLPSVILASEGSFRESVKGGEEGSPLVLELDRASRTMKGLPQAGVRLALSGGHLAMVAGVKKITDGIFRWLPALQKVELLLRQTTASLEALGSSA